MRLREGGLSNDPRSVRGNVVSSVEIPRNRTEDKTENLSETEEDNDFITKGIQTLRLDSRSDLSGQSDGEEGESDDKAEGEEEDDDDDDDVEYTPDMVSKSPSRNKDILKTNIRAEKDPYPKLQTNQTTHQKCYFLYNNNTRGDVTVDVTQDFDPIVSPPPPSDDLIPITVSEYNESEPTVEDIFKTITEIEYNQIDDIIEKHIQEISTADQLARSITTLNHPIQIPTSTTATTTTTIINTPPETEISYASPSPADSLYGTMSPSSTLYSPNPNIQTPKHEMNIISSAESETSLSSSIYDDFNSSPYDNNHYTTDSGWISSASSCSSTSSLPPFVQNVVNNPITTDNTVVNNLLQCTQNISTNNFIDLTNNISHQYSTAPTICCVIPTNATITPANKVTNIPNITDVQKKPIMNGMNPIGRQQYSLPPGDEIKEFTNLLPVKPNGSSTRSLLNIKPGGITVSEIDLNIPAVDRLQKFLSRREKEIAWTVVCLEQESDINAKNGQNQTKLMQILKEQPVKQFLEKIFTRVQRIKKDERRELLKQRDILGNNALYMAAMLNNNKPLIARFIADTYVELNMDPDELYGEDGNSLLHIIAAAGDNYAQVLAELLSIINQETGRKVFKINRTNKNLLTPLHVAAKTHSKNLSTLAITQLLVKHGAQLSVQDKNRNTCLHSAIDLHHDPIYVKALLQSPYASQCINMVNDNEDTALHIISKKNDISYIRQKDIINQLITSGASHNNHNKDGCLALQLVCSERKPEIKNLFNKKSSPNQKYYLNGRL